MAVDRVAVNGAKIAGELGRVFAGSSGKGWLSTGHLHSHERMSKGSGKHMETQCFEAKDLGAESGLSVGSEGDALTPAPDGSRDLSRVPLDP